jgi:hypothetical protein
VAQEPLVSRTTLLQVVVVVVVMPKVLFQSPQGKPLQSQLQQALQDLSRLEQEPMVHPAP